MTSAHDDHHQAEGLAQDMATLIRRRTALTGLVAAGGLLALGQGALAADACLAPATETSGPYPADGSNSKDGQVVNVLELNGVQRTDLKGSFAGLTGTAKGLPLRLQISLASLTGACAPLAGLAVYAWHCNSDGKYSIYDLPEVNYLRGLGVADANGLVRFATIFPGCYDGRWPHIHFEVFASAAAALAGKDALLTSQFALPGDVCKAVYAATDGYAASVDNLTRQSLTADMVFGDNSASEMQAMTLAVTQVAATGAVATAMVGLAV